MANIRARGFRFRREATDSARQPEQVGRAPARARSRAGGRACPRDCAQRQGEALDAGLCSPTRASAASRRGRCRRSRRTSDLLTVLAVRRRPSPEFVLEPLASLGVARTRCRRVDSGRTRCTLGARRACGIRAKPFVTRAAHRRLSTERRRQTLRERLAASLPPAIAAVSQARQRCRGASPGCDERRARVPAKDERS
jgi:hypothetical protein